MPEDSANKGVTIIPPPMPSKPERKPAHDPVATSAHAYAAWLPPSIAKMPKLLLPLLPRLLLLAEPVSGWEGTSVAVGVGAWSGVPGLRKSKSFKGTVGATSIRNSPMIRLSVAWLIRMVARAPAGAVSIAAAARIPAA